MDDLFLQIYLTQNRRQRIQELLEKQEKLKMELADAKRILMVDPTTWSYDCERSFSCSILDTYFDDNYMLIFVVGYLIHKYITRGWTLDIVNN